MFPKFSVLACGIATSVSAHMLMNTPQPFAAPALHNGPLQPDGSDFPCQITAGGSVSAGGASNSFALGSTQPLQFTGQAVHGGGSCQVSITYDTTPTKNSVWKVIQSIEGGCPAEGQTGNMGDDASAADPFKYNFTIPDNIPTGQVSLAWTWFNKIGNREMYMNCAPVTLTGSSGDKANFDSLPDMFVANAGNGCVTEDSKDLLFPNPGAAVVQLNGATSAFAKPTGTCQAPVAGGSGSGSGSGSSPSSPTPAPAAPSPTAAPQPPASAGVPGGVFATVAPSAAAAPSSAAPAPSASAAAPSASAAPSPAPASASSPSSSGSSSGSSGSQAAGSACSPEGAWNCLGTSYQQCASGTWSVVMPLAAGTSCTPGQGSSININAAGKKSKRVAVRFRG